MNPIRRFEITGMSASGFKCYEDAMTAEFGSQTVITGGNGRGKSSVADAIAFAVTGKPFFGESGIDRLYADGGKDLTVSLTITDESGAEHLLTRTRRADRMTITYDGRELRQSDLTVLFGEKDVFLSIFNPLYFIEELGDDGRRLLERHLPAVPLESVMALLNKDVRELIGSEEILSPDTYLKRRREELRELEDSVIYLTGQKDHAETQMLDAKQRAAALSGEIAGIEGEIRALEEKRFTGGSMEDVQERLTELSARYEEMAKEPPESPDTSKLDGELNTLHRKLGERSADQYAPKYAAPIADVTAKVKTVAARYKRELAALNGFKAGTVCPTCRRTVTEAELPAVKAELQKSVDALFAEGKSIKGQLDELNSLEAKTEATFRQFQTDDVAAMQSKIAELEQQRSEIIAAASARNERRRNEPDAMLAEIRSLSAEADCGALSPEELERLNERKKALEGRQAEYAALLLTANAAPEDFDAKIGAVEDKIAEKKKRIAAAAQYVAKRTELLFSGLKMNRVEISLYDVVKTTGEVRDTFRFTYNGRRYANVMRVTNAEAYRALTGDSRVYAWPTRSEPKYTERQPTALAERDAVYTEMLSYLTLLPKHRANLRERGLSDERIEENGYKSIPERETDRRLLARLVRAEHDLPGIPGFYQRFGEWTLAGPNGFLIPVRDKDGLIQGMKIRLDSEENPTRKYRWLSSRDKNLQNGTRSYSWIHVTGDRTRKRAYITEGPLKGDVASYLANGALFVCTGGVNAIHGLKETIEELGVSGVVEAMDMDQMVNPQVRNGILAMRREVMKIPNIKYSKYTWNPAYKGVDDYFLSRVAEL